MRKKRLCKNTIIIFNTIVFIFIIFLINGCFRKNKIEISNQITKEIYFNGYVNVGDSISFEWEHSFEHIIWKEFYKVTEDYNFELYTIAVEGFGAGIPAEMECKYRFQDGLIYMEEIKGSKFKEFNWINSKKQLKKISHNGKVIIRGEDLPERKKIKLKIKD